MPLLTLRDPPSGGAPEGSSLGATLRRWLQARAQGRAAIWWLIAIALCNGIFFPLPPETLLVPLLLLTPERARVLWLVTTLASVIGGAGGYLLGFGFGASLAIPLITWLGADESFAAFQQAYATWGGWGIAIAGITAIPYKIATIGSGLLGFPFGTFLLISALSRGLRFALVVIAITWLRRRRELFLRIFRRLLAMGHRWLVWGLTFTAPNTRRRLVILTLVGLGSAGAVALTLFLHYGLGVLPCSLCLKQRWLLAAAAALALLAASRRQGAWGALFFLGTILLLASNAALAAYHLGVEQQWWPPPGSCAAGSIDFTLSNLNVRALLNAHPFVPCDLVAWSLAGLSLSAYNLLLSLGSLCLCAFAVLRPGSAQALPGKRKG